MTLLAVNLDRVRPFNPWHRHFMLPDSKNTALVAGATWYHQCVLDTNGILYPCTWLHMETAEGVYNFSNMLTTLNYAQTYGKKVIIRVFYKTYIEGEAKPLPAYILNDHATYGGSAGSGGLVANQYKGWSSRLSNANVLNRFKALITAMAAAVGDHPALEGVSLDESTWSLTIASGTWPAPGITAQDLVTSFAAINGHLKTCFPDKKVFVFINFFEGTGPSAVRAIWRDYVANGYLPAITDTFPRPTAPDRIQDTDSCFPAGVETLMDIEWMSTGEDDSGLTERMIQNAMETARQGVSITAWYTRGGASSNYWTAIKNAISVCS